MEKITDMYGMSAFDTSSFSELSKLSGESSLAVGSEK